MSNLQTVDSIQSTTLLADKTKITSKRTQIQLFITQLFAFYIKTMKG